MKTTLQLSSVQWIWRQIAVSVPADWEMLQFSSEYNRGRCAFADRYQYRLEVSWSMVKGEPDYERMVSDYTSKLEQEKKLTGPEPAKKAGWFGFSGHMEGSLTSRFGRYFEPIGCLLECVFIWPQGRNTDVETEVLSSIKSEPANAQGLQRWRAFGLDIRVPPGAALDGCTAQPAKAVFSFTNTRNGSMWKFERLGMVKSWMRTDVEQWLRQQMDASVKELRVTHRTVRGVDIVTAEAVFKPGTLHLRNGNLSAAAWICPEDGRLYHVSARLRGNAPQDRVAWDTLLTAAPEFTPRWPS